MTLPHKDSGYALVELLASLLIMGMLAGMLISGISAGRRAWERMDAGTEAGEQVGGAQLLLRQRLERIYPVTLFNSMPPGTDFDGQSASMTFIAPPRVAQSPSALRRYKLWLSPKGELVLSTVSTVAVDPKTPTENLVLLRGVQALDLAYFGPNNKGVPGWQLQWSHLPKIPSLVRVHVAFESGDDRAWPDMLVKPIVTIDSECVFNPATGRCRGRL